MPRRRSRRRTVDYDLRERLTGRTLQYIDVDYLASAGSIISCTKYVTLSKRKTKQKLVFTSHYSSEIGWFDFFWHDSAKITPPPNETT